MATIGTYYITVIPDMSQFSKSFTKSGKSAGSDFSGGFIDMVKASAIGSAIGSVITTGINEIGSALGKGIERLDILTNYPKVMVNLGYSAQEASASIKTISDTLVGLPSSTQDLAMFTQTIADSTHDLGLATDSALSFNAALLASGASYGDQVNAQNMLNKILGAGTVTAQRWTSLMAVMPAQLSMVAEHLLGAGTDAYALGEALKSGEVSTTDLLKAFQDLGPTFDEQARAMTGGIGTAMTNMQNRFAAGWAAILGAIGQERISGTINTISTTLMNGMKSLAGPVRGVINAFDLLTGAASGSVDELGPVGRIVYEVGRYFKDAIEFIKPAVSDVFGAITTNAVPALEMFAGFIRDVRPGVEQFGTTMASSIAPTVMAFGQAFQDVLPDVQTIAGDLMSTFRELAPFITDVLGLVIQAILKLLPVVTKLGQIVIKVVGSLIKTVTGAWNTIKSVIAAAPQAVTNMQRGIVNTLNGLAAGIGQIFNGIKNTAAQVWSNIVNSVTTQVNNIKTNIANAFNSAATSVQNALNNAKNFVTAVWASISSAITFKVNEIKGYISAGFAAVTTSVTSAWNGVKTTITNAINGAKDAVNNALNGIKGFFSGFSVTWPSIGGTSIGSVLESAKTKISTAIEGIKKFFSGFSIKWPTISGTNIGNIISSAKTTIDNAIKDIKGFFNTTLRFPSIKLPHFRVSGGTAPWGIGGMGTPPSFHIDWYAKGGYLSSATLIGAGEAGREAILPVEHRRNMQPFAAAVADNLGAVGGVTVNVSTLVVREEADVNRISTQLYNKVTAQMRARL